VIVRLLAVMVLGTEVYEVGDRRIVLEIRVMGCFTQGETFVMMT
jgi:hypothetical protein